MCWHAECLSTDLTDKGAQMKGQLNMGTKGRVAGMALAAAVALFGGASQADAATYQATFQGLTFTFEQTDADTLTFEIEGTPSGDWTGVQYLGAFDLKNLGLDFGSETAIANGPGATNLLGLNAQLSASAFNCASMSSPPPSICFNLNPDAPLGPSPIDLMYTIDFSTALNIGSTGPHLQIVFTNTVNGPKVGSLYSQDVGLCVNCNGQVPEPGTLALLGLGLGLAGYFGTRRRKL